MKDEVLKEILKGNTFLQPYLKRFMMRLPKDSHIAEINLQKNELNILESISLDIVPIALEQLTNKLELAKQYDGIIISFSFDALTIEERECIFINLNKLLKKNGYLLIINKIISDSLFLPNYIELTFQELFLEEELIGDAHWQFFLYKRGD